MATFVVCTRCGKTKEISVPDELPKGWQRTGGELRCTSCTDTAVLDPDGTNDVLDEEIDVLDEEIVLDEEVVYPVPSDTLDESLDENFDEGYCDVCRGPCQGH